MYLVFGGGGGFDQAYDAFAPPSLGAPAPAPAPATLGLGPAPAKRKGKVKISLTRCPAADLFRSR